MSSLTISDKIVMLSCTNGLIHWQVKKSLSIIVSPKVLDDEGKPMHAFITINFDGKTIHIRDGYKFGVLVYDCNTINTTIYLKKNEFKQITKSIEEKFANTASLKEHKIDFRTKPITEVHYKIL
jgi:hypothetical protein